MGVRGIRTRDAKAALYSSRFMLPTSFSFAIAFSEGGIGLDCAAVSFTLPIFDASRFDAASSTGLTGSGGGMSSSRASSGRRPELVLGLDCAVDTLEPAAVGWRLLVRGLELRREDDDCGRTSGVCACLLSGRD
eukprot:TRINITY_DN11634_c0_g3_i2.p3 TRINITY_DN11634_c0_g3~~TRINITY_DN11634_c0_g3_i2.p3  ORF type:complete len:134 (-),score=9.55 TRINITY_DN11634_c0_g3_i2:1668-2069(-)